MSNDCEFDRTEWLIDSPTKLHTVIQENDELISILVISV